MRRLIRLIVLSAMLLTSLTIPMGAASATTSGGFDAATSTCSGGTGYPVQAGATLMVSTTTPYSGQTIEVSGTNFRAGERVTLDLNGKQVGQVTADSNGSFKTSLKLTSAPGKFELTATGSVCGIAGLFLAIRAGAGILPVSATKSPAAGGVAAGQGGGSGLAFTGLDIAALIAIAAVLLAGGGYLAHAGRRRSARRT